MPINNDILGIYKSVFITVAGGTARSYIVESASRSVTIDASPKVLMQGSPKTRIMDIGGVTETISIQAPILIGGGASADGRAIATQKINEILDPTSATKAPKVNLSYHSFITCPTKLFLAKTKAIISTRIN